MVADAFGIVMIALYFFTITFTGRAVEVSVQNASQRSVFAYLDYTGRHGKSTVTVKLKTKAGGETPSGLLIHSSTTRFFGAAVGVGDSPTLYVLPVDEGGGGRYRCCQRLPVRHDTIEEARNAIATRKDQMDRPLLSANAVMPKKENSNLT